MTTLDKDLERHACWVEGWVAGINAAKERILFGKERIMDVETHNQLEDILKNLDMDKKNALAEKPRTKQIIVYGNA